LPDVLGALEAAAPEDERTPVISYSYGAYNSPPSASLVVYEKSGKVEAWLFAFTKVSCAGRLITA
jgi:hypothetical protein